MLKCVVLKIYWRAHQLMWKRSCVDGLKQYLPSWGRYVKDTRNSTDFIPGVGIICLEDLLSVAAVTE